MEYTWPIINNIVLKKSSYMKPKLFVALSLGVCIAACNDVAEKKETPVKAVQYEKLDSTQWLLGNWFNRSKDGEATEIWEKLNDSTFSAESFVIAGNDTVFYESVKLQERNKDIHYVVSVKEQNNEAPVSFKLVSVDGSKLVFENPAHNFPSRITYTRLTDDSLYAEISGMVKGQERKEGFPFKKIK